VTTDLYGNVILTGYFYSSLDFDPGPGTFILHVDNTISSTNVAIFVLKLDPDGKFIWAKKMGGPYRAIGYSVKTDKRGNVYTAGRFHNEADFDPGPDSYILRPSPMAVTNTASHYFISKLDANGDFVWAVSASDDIYPNFFGRSVFVDKYSNVYLTGLYFLHGGDFDPGPDTFFLEFNGHFIDVFVLKLSQCQPTSDTVRITACHSYTWLDGLIYTESTANAKYIVENKAGCDSIITLDLTILKPDSTLVYDEACRRFEWKGDTLYQSGIYQYDSVNAEGCDSTIFLYLTIHEPDTVLVGHTSCDSYIWHDQLYDQSGTYYYDTINIHGCDSTVMLNLTINHSSVSDIYQSACDSYTWIGSTYTVSGIYEYKTQTAAGCDSTVYLNLTINASDSISQYEFACHSYTWNGNTYMESGTYMYNTINNAGCDSTLTLHLTILEHLENTDTIAICEGDTIEIFGNPISTAGEISEVFTSVSGCDSTQTYIVAVTALPQGYIAASVCEGDSMMIYGQWFSEAGQYTVMKPNQGSCDSLLHINISQLPAKYSFDTLSLCRGDTLLLDGNVITTETDIQRLLVSAESCDSISHIHIAMLEPSQSYREIKLCPGDSILIAGRWIRGDATIEEHFTAHNSCDSLSVTKITEIEEPGDPAFGLDCESREVEVVIEAPADWNILWDDGTEGPRTRYKDRTHATVLLTSIPDCIRSFGIDLPLIPDISIIKLPSDTTIKYDVPLKIGLDLDTSVWQLLWSPSGIMDCEVCNEVVITPESGTDIKLLLTHTSGCTYEVYFRISLEESEISVPNIFSPDGDGINDEWKVIMPPGIELQVCQVFDRWGELVYRTGQSSGQAGKSGQIIWDGRFKGRQVPIGVYVYVIHYTQNGEKKVMTGDITVIR
jgi:gliding motility-associated-like protein